MNETYLRGFKIRLFPTKEQEELMWKHVNASRFIWNKCKEIHDNAYKNNGKQIFLFDMINMLIDIKDDYPFLKDVSNHTLQLTVRDLYYAYDMFFKKVCRFPKFKSKKKSSISFPIRREDHATYLLYDNKYVKIPKFKEYVKCTFDYDINKNKYKIIDYRLHNPRINYTHGKWILSAAFECEKQVFEPEYKRMGIDLGVEYLATISYGHNNYDCEDTRYININKSSKMKKLESRIRHLCRNINRKYEANKELIESTGDTTNNMKKSTKKLRNAYYKIHCIRNDYMHKLSHYLVYYKRPYCITMETLSINNMVKNRCLAKSIHDASLYTFMDMIRYKCERTTCVGFSRVPRNYPSSKTCSNCGNIKHDLKLSNRTYICDVCGNIINRDINAARNLRDYFHNKRK